VNERRVEFTVTELESTVAYIVKGLDECLKPLIAYLDQNVLTAAESQQLKNAEDAKQAFETAQARLVKKLPERRD